jgi:hypothetical protein
MVALPVDFSALTGVIQASQFDQNFVALNAKFGQLTSADISPNAGILPTQLSAPFTFRDTVFDLTDHGSGATWSTKTAYTLDAAPALQLRRRIRGNPGQVIYLCEVEIYAEDITAGSAAAVPQVQVWKNGALLAGLTFNLDTDNDFFVARRSSPKTNPLFSFVDNDIISYYLGYSDATGTDPTTRRIQVREHWKEQLGT